MRELTIAWEGDTDSLHLDALVKTITQIQAVEAFDTLGPIARAYPTQGAVTPLVPRTAMTNNDVSAAVLNLTGKEPTCGAIAFVILRRAPIDAELSLFRSQDTIAAGPLFDWVADLAERQIFGAGRRPVVLAFKGA